MPNPLQSSVRNRLVLLFFAITAAAVGFVYLYVVPQLSSSLTAERLERLERLGAGEAARLERAAARDLDRSELTGVLQRTAAETESRVTILGVRDGEPRFVVADSESDAEASLVGYPPATGTAVTGSTRSAVTSRAGRRIGETSIPVGPGGSPVWVAVLSTSLDEVESNVSLIRRQILIAGAIALTAALLAAWFAATAHARRLRRLEAAAEEVAGGNFRVPLPTGSRDEVGQLARSFDEMQSRLARLDSARREFIANASHELRTPVASLGGFIELLEEADEPDEEARREFVATMKGQVERLTKLTTDLLDLSKLDADAIRLSSEQVDLTAIAGEALAEFEPLATAAGATLSLRSDSSATPLARADRARTMQIMRILIDNAIKHTSQGTEITIETNSSPRRAEISVSDDGPGIEPAHRDRVFERFHTGDSASGSGLGLAIARELARLMGGELSMSSRRGRTTFTLELPGADAGAAA